MRLEVLRAVGATAWEPVDGREDERTTLAVRGAGRPWAGGRSASQALSGCCGGAARRPGGCRGSGGRLWQPDQAAAATVHEVTRLEGQGA